jgi:membrane protein YdbS with pleckstrin-like domain
MAGDWQHPSPRLRTVRRLEVGVVTIVVAVAAAAIAVASGAQALALVLVAVALVVGIAIERVAQRRVSAWGYCERDDDLLVRRGVMFQRLSVVPYGRMQFVDVTAGPVERSFGLATVQLHTAAASSDARIPGLAATEAARLRDQLARLGEARAAGL